MPIDIRRIIDELVRGNLSNESTRLAEADRCFDFFHGRFEKYPTRQDNSSSKRDDRRRTRRIMRRIIEVLTESLYKKPPTRTLAAGADATAWLHRCYSASRMGAVWPKADQFCHVADVAALQFWPNRDESTLVDIRLWGANDLVVWCEPGDPLTPAAVGVIDRFDASARLRVWTAEAFLTFTRPKVGPEQTSGGRAWTLVADEANVLGLVPFAFVHAEIPTVGFWTDGPGGFLATLNDNLNGQLDDLGDNIRFGIAPIMVSRNVNPAYVPPAKLRPGQALNLPAANPAADDLPVPDPTFEYITPPAEYVGVSWDDMNRQLDAGLEDCGIPPGTIRMVGNAESGVAMLIETGPLVKRAEGRRLTFDDFENRAARTCAAVAAAYLRALDRPVPAWLDATAADASPLALRWAPLYVQLPGAERDRSDDWRLSRGIADVVDVLMERDDLTEDEAMAKLAALARRRPRLAALGILPPAPDPAASGPAGEAAVSPELVPQNAE